jgi:hypothetical protein
LLHSKEDGGEESSEESVNDEEDDEDDDGPATAIVLGCGHVQSSEELSTSGQSF